MLLVDSDSLRTWIERFKQFIVLIKNLGFNLKSPQIIKKLYNLPNIKITQVHERGKNI